MIDFDNPNTFPKELKNWGTEFEKMILRRVNIDNIEEGWQIEHQLQDAGEHQRQCKGNQLIHNAPIAHINFITSLFQFSPPLSPQKIFCHKLTKSP